MDRTIGIEELLGEAGWLRRLAASLVRDPAQAEDLVQDTWVAALRRPPRAEGEARPWLARVARNLASNRRRERDRRETRESFAHEDRSPGQPGDLAQEAEAQRLLAEAVTRLPEPLRDAVVLRYFQGLDSNAVAARLGVPASTVRTRLQRALEELRADLDRRSPGGREGWALLLVPLLRDPAPAAVAVGSWTIWVACAGAAGALALVGTNALAPEREVESASPAAAVVLESPAEESTPLALDVRPESERVAGASVVPAPAAATVPVASEVSGVVRVDGRPPEWPIRLALEPTLPPQRGERALRERTPRPEIELAPDGRGTFSFEGVAAGWSGRLRVDGYRFADGQSALELGAPARGLVLDLRSGPEIVGRILDPEGRPVPGIHGEYELRTGQQGSESHESLSEEFVSRADGAFRIPILTSADWGIVTILVEERDRGFLQLESPPFACATGTDLGVLDLEALRPLEFTVRDQDGAPLQDAFARVAGPGSMKQQGFALTDGAGVLPTTPDRAIDVRFDAVGHRGRVMRTEPGSRLEVVLERLAVLEVRLPKGTALLRVSADRSAFVWDDDGWKEDGGLRPSRRTTPAAAGQRFEYDFRGVRGGLAHLAGLRPDVDLTVEAFDRAGRSIDARVTTVRTGARAELELVGDR